MESEFEQEIRGYLTEGGFDHNGYSESEIDEIMRSQHRKLKISLLEQIRNAERYDDKAKMTEIRRVIWMLLDGYPSRDG